MSDSRVGVEPADALTYATGFSAEAETKVTLFAERQSDEPMLGFSLGIGEGLAGDFRNVATQFALALSARTLVPYTPGRKPDDHELVHLPASEVPELAHIAEVIEGPTQLEVFKPDSREAGRLRLYVVSVRRSSSQWIHFPRHMSSRSRLVRSNKIAAALMGGVYDRLEADVFLFDQSFDAIVSQGFAFISNQGQFERSLGFLEEAGEAASETLVKITGQLRIKNLDALLVAASSDNNMISKIRGIQAKMSIDETYARSMTMEKLTEFIRSSGIEVDVEEQDGQEHLVFYPDPPRRWRILKLLDDDYLHSQLTSLDYESNSKVSRSA